MQWPSPICCAKKSAGFSGSSRFDPVQQLSRQPRSRQLLFEPRQHGPSSSYFTLSGTRMATGVVSGFVADLLQKYPSLNPDQVKARLMKTAWKTVWPPNRSRSTCRVVHTCLHCHPERDFEFPFGILRVAVTVITPGFDDRSAVSSISTLPSYGVSLYTVP
jgi:subtilisin family serine protease